MPHRLGHALSCLLSGGAGLTFLHMIRRYFFVFFLLLSCLPGFATGEAATYFEIFVPPNNDAVRRDVALIVTAIYDSTTFEITDDGRDGDSDDSVSGLLMAGQSYVLLIRDGAVNDDANAPGGSGAKQDGDFFVIRSSNLVIAFQSCRSDWQHDFVPATNRSSLGTRFIVYAPPTSNSPRDLNVFAFEDSTRITLRKISTTPVINTGYTLVDPARNDIALQRLLNVGEDIIYYHTNGRNLLETGGTYILETNKPVSVQCGALFGNERDGGAYVPSSNGSSSGELFYFAVPVQAPGDQEIRIVSWDEDNEVALDVFQNGSWVSLADWTLDRLQPGEWLSRDSYNRLAVFRVSCTPGKRVSVFEANWLETGSPGTSDIGTMASAEDGTSAGKEFLIYLPPPGRQTNVTNPFTGLKFGGDFSHAYIFSRKNARVTVKDAFTNGATLNRTYNVPAGYYVDCAFSLNEWRSIYNGDGKPSSGPQRPYVIIESDEPISVFNTNFNDNWMCYFGTSQTQDFGVDIEIEDDVADPGDTLRIVSELIVTDTVEDADVTIVVGDGATVVESNLVNQTQGSSTPGNISVNPGDGNTTVNFGPVGNLDPQNQYSTETEIVLNNNFNNGDPIPNNTVIAVETIVSGTINDTYQQASTAAGVTNETANRPPPLFFRVQSGQAIVSDSASNLSVSFGDYSGDGLQDVYLPSNVSGQAHLLYRNLGSRNFQQQAQGDPVETVGAGGTATWGDCDNDGDADLFVSFVGGRSLLFRNEGGVLERDDRDEASRYSGSCFNASWVDYDRDGWLDIFVSEYISNRPSLLFRNQGEGVFRRAADNLLAGNANSIGAVWCDYDNDGWPDLYVPNDNGQNNYLFRNLNGERFERLDSSIVARSGGFSTGASWGDYDNDGDFDLFVANANNQANFLFRNEGGSRFTRITEGAIVSDRGDSQGSVWGDFDNDGDLDLFVTQADEGRHLLYFNQGDGTFSREAESEITRMQGYILGVAHADIDNDGDLDLMAANHFGGRNYLWINNTSGQKYLEVRLTGSLSNRGAIGAVVRVKGQIGGRNVWQMRQVEGQSGGGPGAQSAPVLHFGMGDAPRADSIVINWPSGNVQVLAQQNLNQLLAITEEEGTLVAGRAYVDADSSCTYTPGEAGIPNQLIRVQPGNRRVMTDERGNYSLRLPNGSYTLAQESSPYYTQRCPVNPPTYSFSIGGGGSGRSGSTYPPSSGVQDCSSCSQTLSGTISNNITVAAGQRVCVAEGATLSGGVTIEAGGELVICGSNSSAFLNIQGGGSCVLVVSGSGEINLPSLNIARGLTVINYGEFRVSGSLTIDGRLENYGNLSASGLNINGQASLINGGTLSLAGGLNNSNELVNYGQISVSGDVNNNGSARFENRCSLVATGNVNQNGELAQYGYLQAGGTMTFNGGGDNFLEGGSRIQSASLLLNGDLEGPGSGPAASLTVSGSTVVNGGAVLEGRVDLCDDNGIETFNGTLGSGASTDCSGRVSGQPCDDGQADIGYTGFDFGNRAQCVTPNLTVALTANILRRGFEAEYGVQLSNNSTAAASDVELTVDFPQFVHPRRASIPWSDSTARGTGSRLTWRIPSLAGLERFDLSITDSIAANTPPETFILATAAASFGGNECNPADNSDFSEDEVVGSYDPNDKLAYPAGAGPAHLILGSDTLYYRIRFQNVGNYLASRVVIHDTLSENLDPASFVPGPMSHLGYVALRDSGLLIWTFDNINLPDSASDEPGSHGFVQFKILPRSGLENESRIENRAAIYFDFNEPIITNTVFHTVSDRLSYEEDYLLALSVYPNPLAEASGRITVYNLRDGIVPVPLDRVEVFDSMGRRVAELAGEGRSEILFDRSGLPPGPYFLVGRDIHGFRYSGNILLK